MIKNKKPLKIDNLASLKGCLPSNRIASLEDMDKAIRARAALRHKNAYGKIFLNSLKKFPKDFEIERNTIPSKRKFAFP
jgi:hypothetical protein